MKWERIAVEKRTTLTSIHPRAAPNKTRGPMFAQQFLYIRRRRRCSAFRKLEAVKIESSAWKVYVFNINRDTVHFRRQLLIKKHTKGKLVNITCTWILRFSILAWLHHRATLNLISIRYIHFESFLGLSMETNYEMWCKEILHDRCNLWAISRNITQIMSK